MRKGFILKTLTSVDTGEISKIEKKVNEIYEGVFSTGSFLKYLPSEKL